MSGDEDHDKATGQGDTEPLQTISTFANAVGLSTSALRFYGEQGLVVPAEVDLRTGYRYYTPEQQRRAILVRRLRDADVPLADVRTVLDGAPGIAAEVLRRHAERSDHRATHIRVVLADVQVALWHGAAGHREDPVTVRLDGAELAGALDQVVGAAAPRGDAAGLDGVLLDLSDQLAMVASDRYWMAWRTVAVQRSAGSGNRRVLVPADAVAEVSEWARSRIAVDLTLRDSGATLSAVSSAALSAANNPADQLPLPPADDRFPSYQQIYEALPATVLRLVVPREPLVAFANAASRSAVRIGQLDDADTPTFGFTSGAEVLPCIGIGQSLAVTVSDVLLRRAVGATVGRQLVVELTGPHLPLVLRGAEQSGFRALVMPRR